jgi:hypothetical protein
MSDKNEFYKAMVSVQADLEPAIKSKKNPHFNSKYVPLNQLIETIRPILAKHGMGFVQKWNINDAASLLNVELSVFHGASGQTDTSTSSIPIPKKDPQGVGSAITYGCRYQLNAYFGIANDDDDGNAASNVNGEEHRPSQPKQPPAHVEAFHKKFDAIVNGFGIKSSHGRGWLLSNLATNKLARPDVATTEALNTYLEKTPAKKAAIISYAIAAVAKHRHLAAEDLTLAIQEHLDGLGTNLNEALPNQIKAVIEKAEQGEFDLQKQGS